MNPRNINRHQSLAGIVCEKEGGTGGSERETSMVSQAHGDDVSTFVMPTTLFITVARHGAL